MPGGNSNLDEDKDPVRSYTCAEQGMPGCFGQKKCPKGPNNENRWLCPLYGCCLERYIVLELGKRRSPITILGSLKEIINDSDGYGWSDYVLLNWMGQVASANGYCFGRKKVDRAIRESLVNEDPNAALEKNEIRKAFGVYGREGMHRAKNIPIGQTRRVEIGQEANQ